MFKLLYEKYELYNWEKVRNLKRMQGQVQEKEMKDSQAKCQPAPEQMKALVVSVMKMGPPSFQTEDKTVITFEYYMSCMRLIADTTFQHLFGMQK